MRLKYLWRGAALVVLGTTAGFLAFDYVDQHPEAAATAMAGLSRYPLAALNLLVGGQAEQNGTDVAQSKDPKPDVAAASSPTEEASEPGRCAACNDPRRKTYIITLHNIEAADAVTILQQCSFAADMVIVAEPVTNKLIVNCLPGDCDRISSMIEQIDVQPPMVQIEALIAEVVCKDGKAALGDLSDGVRDRAMSSAEATALIRDLQKQGLVHVISTPTILTTDNQSARILVGQNFPYVTGTTETPDTEGNPTVTNTVAYRDVGIQVQVTPKISPDGTVTMRIVPEITEAVPTTTEVSSGVFATAFNVQTLETTVTVKDGETRVIGGMMRMRDAGTSWFGFRQMEKTEMLVFVTPHVVNR